VQTAPVMSSSPDPSTWESLDQAATATPLTPGHPQISPVTDPLSSSPGPPVLATKKSNVESKKDKAREEKERKAAEKAAKDAAKEAEKEREKAERARRKDVEIKRKEVEKEQAAELKAAIEASKASKAEEDKKLAAEGANKENGTASATAPHVAPVSGAIGRFSKTLSVGKSSKKPKFWGNKDGKKDDPATVDEEDEEEHMPTSQTTLERTKTNRFSLRKKPSNM